jgi:hypothetical protein
MKKVFVIITINRFFSCFNQLFFFMSKCVCIMYANRTILFHVLTYDEYYINHYSKYSIFYRICNSTTMNICMFKIMREIGFISFFPFFSHANKVVSLLFFIPLLLYELKASDWTTGFFFCFSIHTI